MQQQDTTRYIKETTTSKHTTKKYRNKKNIAMNNKCLQMSSSQCTTCWFHIFSDASGLGAGECIAEGNWEQLLGAQA